MAEMDGKTMVIAGVGRGLGREVALVAHREGAQVVLGARTDAVIRAVAEEIDPNGGRASFATCDITRDEDCRRLTQLAIERFGRLDALVNCAALDTVFGGLERADFAEWRRLLDVNLFGSLQMTRAALPELRPRRGSVVS